MSFLMSAIAMMFDAEGIELNKTTDIAGDEHLSPQKLYFNPRYVVEISAHPGKPGQCFVTISGEQYTVMEPAEALVKRINEHMARLSYLN